MLYLDRVPSPPLDRVLSSIWICQAEPRPFALERVLPTGSAQLIVNLKEDQTRGYDAASGAVTTSSGSLLSGIATRYGIIDTAEQECVAGVCFRPGGTIPFFAVPPDLLCSKDVPLDALWGRARVDRLRDRLLTAPTPNAKLTALERAMAEAWTGTPVDPAIEFAVSAFSGTPHVSTIPAVAGSAGLSSKRLVQRFKSVVGMAPKRYCRIMRFQRALTRAESGRCVDWTRIAVECGYFDQAHFIHDFRSFAGITPTGYDSARTQFRNHVHFLQSATAVEMR